MGLSFSFICGFMLGFELIDKDELEIPHATGGFALDLGIIRVLVIFFSMDPKG